MKSESDFLPEGKEPELSAEFQDKVIGRIRKHHRRKQRAVNSLVFFAVLGASFIYRRTKDDFREIPVEQNSRVASAAHGVEWLVQAQNPDGSWSNRNGGGHPAFDEGVSALATLALLNAPNPVDRGVLDRAIASLESSLHNQPNLFRNGPQFYNTLFQLYALGEVEKQMPDPQRKVLLEKVYTAFLRNQQLDGGWGYPEQRPMGYGEDSTANTAVTWWICHLIENRPRLRLKDPDQALLKGKAWLAQRNLPGGKVAYQENNGPVANKEDALFWMLAKTPSVPDVESPAHADTYRDYFRAAKIQQDSIRRNLQQTQNQNGAWINPDDRWWQAGGAVYMTALSVLSQVPKGV